MKKHKVRKHSIAWWAQKAATGLLVAAVILMAGMGDAPPVDKTEETPEPVRTITYIPAEDLPDPEEEAPEDTSEPEKIPMGEFTITYYCSCEICCGEWSNPENPLTASGEPAVDGITVGADWNLLPAGTAIEIEGVGRRIVQDKPASWIIDRYDGKVIDVYCGSHEGAKQKGKHTAKVWITE